MADSKDPKNTPHKNTTALTATNSQIGTTAQVTGSPGATVHQVHIAANDSPISSAIVAGAFKFTQLAEMMLGPATRELAEMWQDQVRAYRYERQLKCVVKAEKMAKEAGFTPKAVPIKLLFPLLEGASLEEDEELHTMWAALLANAAVARNVKPGYIAILKGMSPDEAAMLKSLRQFEAATQVNFTYGKWTPESDLVRMYGDLGLGSVIDLKQHPYERDPTYLECIDRLLSERLVVSKDGLIGVSTLGVRFVEACSPPKPKS